MEIDPNLRAVLKNIKPWRVALSLSLWAATGVVLAQTQAPLVMTPQQYQDYQLNEDMRHNETLRAQRDALQQQKQAAHEARMRHMDSQAVSPEIAPPPPNPYGYKVGEISRRSCKDC